MTCSWVWQQVWNQECKFKHKKVLLIYNIIKINQIGNELKCNVVYWVFYVTKLSIYSLQKFCPFLGTVRFYEVVTACEVLCALWKCCVSLERHPKTSDHEYSLCLVWCLEVVCVCPQNWQHTACFSLLVHHLKGFTLWPRRPTTIMNRRLMLWIPSVCNHQCFSHCWIELQATVCKDKDLMGTTDLFLSVSVWRV